LNSFIPQACGPSAATQPPCKPHPHRRCRPSAILALSWSGMHKNEALRSRYVISLGGYRFSLLPSPLCPYTMRGYPFSALFETMMPLDFARPVALLDVIENPGNVPPSAIPGLLMSLCFSSAFSFPLIFSLLLVFAAVLALFDRRCVRAFLADILLGMFGACGRLALSYYVYTSLLRVTLGLHLFACLASDGFDSVLVPRRVLPVYFLRFLLRSPCCALFFPDRLTVSSAYRSWGGICEIVDRNGIVVSLPLFFAQGRVFF